MSIFISYGHDEHEKLIRKIADDLTKSGIDVWIDYECLYGSSKWEERIEQGIQTSSWVVVFMTNHAMRRPDGYCLDEISYARLHNKKIVPIKIQNIAPPISIARIQWLDMSQYALKDGTLNEEYYQAKKAELIDILNGLKECNINADVQYLLLNKLKPLDNESYLVPNKKFYGRAWLFAQYENWLTKMADSRVFAIVGSAGSGKTAFVSKLCERSNNVVAIHFCRYNNEERANPKRAIMSLAYHLSTQLPEYKEQLVQLADIEKLQDKDTSRLFEYLFIEPLMKISPPNCKLVMIIDALDEATKNMKNELIELIVRDFYKTPSWLGLVVTSRPEQDIARRLEQLKPIVIVNDSQDNLADIRGFLYCNITPLMTEQQLADKENIIDIILRKSEGNFLYATEIVKAIQNKSLNLDNVEGFPIGLTNVYLSYYNRMFELDTTYDYKKDIRPLMELLSVCFEPLHQDILVDILGIDEYDFEDIKDYIYVLFPCTNGYIEPLHKSLIDWITNKELSGHFAVNTRVAHTRLAEYCGRKYQGKWDSYLVKYITKHFLASKNVQEQLFISKTASCKVSEYHFVGKIQL